MKPIITRTATYAGIGQRETPPYFLEIMRRLARILGKEGRTLHSGGARGADTAFQQGAIDASSPRRIFIPYRMGANPPAYPDPFPVLSDPEGEILVPRMELVKAAAVLAQNRASPTYFPSTDPKRIEQTLRTRGGGPSLHARNAMQVLGRNLQSPVDMVLAYRDPSALRSGTDVGLRLAENQGIPIRNLAIPEHLDRILKWMASRG